MSSHARATEREAMGGVLSAGSSTSRLELLAKRLLDLGLAVPLGAILAPVLALIALAIKLDSPGPVVFRQQRRGRGFQPFTMLKFRTLRHGAPDPHARYEMLAADPRITRVGAFLRRTSLDELPQLLNVIAGSMSLVGPRPLVEWESEAAQRTHAPRFRVKPGVTGLSQVAVRNSTDFHTRLDWDVAYVRAFSLALDLRILLLTPFVVLHGQAIYPTAAAPLKRDGEPSSGDEPQS